MLVVGVSLVGVGVMLVFLACIFLAFLLALVMKLVGYLRDVRDWVIIFSSSTRKGGLHILYPTHA